MSTFFGRKIVGVTLAGAVAISSLGLAAKKEDVQADNRRKQPTNVIMIVMDGTSSTATTLARWYQGGKPLAMDEMASGGVRTYSAESAITDSAPAGTALATGNKSNDKLIGILPSIVNSPGVSAVSEKDVHRPVANVLEGAKQLGKATGIVATSEIQHATPAAYSAHATHRSQYDNIAEQQVYQNIDVVLGGGREALSAGTGKNSRKDGEDLLKVLKAKGYDFVEDKNGLLSTKSSKIWGSFAPNELAYDFDRASAKPNQPTLADMTDKAIKTLNKDKDGFFLFVEGSKVDWAAHANDPIGIISDVLAFDAAVKKALDFAKKDGNTMVIALADHGNSGISIGSKLTDTTYSETPVSTYIDPLKKAKLTVEGAKNLLKEDKSNLKEVADLYGLDNLTAQELETLKNSANITSDMSKMLSNRAHLGFTTGGHTGEDVFLFSYGPSRPTGIIENTDIAKKIAKFMGFDLGILTKKLYIGASESFKKKGYTMRIDVTNASNPVFIAEKEGYKLEIPANKNHVKVSYKNVQKTISVNGVHVYNGKDFYVSENVLKLAK
ncbi:alkaline phosphatase [Peribacillus sp. SCS-155]|uniref:alkaline phosphatase n=1 Tax=Peribacillus sedimenti TaxID=3115297 RepID=UPI003906D38B